MGAQKLMRTPNAMVNVHVDAPGQAKGVLLEEKEIEADVTTGAVGQSPVAEEEEEEMTLLEEEKLRLEEEKLRLEKEKAAAAKEEEEGEEEEAEIEKEEEEIEEKEEEEIEEKEEGETEEEDDKEKAAQKLMRTPNAMVNVHVDAPGQAKGVLLEEKEIEADVTTGAVGQSPVAEEE